MVPVNDPSHALLSLGLGFWSAKAVLVGVELGVFAALGSGPRSRAELTIQLGIHHRGAGDLLDALVALGVLDRTDDRYSNSSHADQFLVPGRPHYVGGALALANARLYPTWTKLGEALRSGLPQNEAKEEATQYYTNLGLDSQRLRLFLDGMTGLSLMSSKALSRVFPWANYRRFTDIGGAHGVLSAQLASEHPHLSGTCFDLPSVAPFFHDYIARFDVGTRLSFQSGDFFTDPFPTADVFVMGHVLHNWDLDQKQFLIRKAHDALPLSGSLVVFEALIDDERRTNAFGLLMSLNMLLVTSGGFVFTGADCRRWMIEAGFRDVRIEHLHGADSMVVATK